jgi:L-threonylcarbamoyladenylate synthase
MLRTPLDAPITDERRMPAAPDAYARALYATLHELESLGCDVIAIEQVPSDGAWAGIRDRLERAAR